MLELRELWLSTLSWLILRGRCEMNEFIKFATASEQARIRNSMCLITKKNHRHEPESGIHVPTEE